MFFRLLEGFAFRWLYVMDFVCKNALLMASDSAGGEMLWHKKKRVVRWLLQR